MNNLEEKTSGGLIYMYIYMYCYINNQDKSEIVEPKIS